MRPTSAWWSAISRHRPMSISRARACCIELHAELAARGIALRIVGAHGWVRDLLRADGIAEKVGGLDRIVTLDHLLGGDGR